MTLFLPLIPANAGTQMAWRRPSVANNSPQHPPFAPFDLGPGIRRDER